MSARYLGVAGLARALGVSRQWVTKYRAEYGPESDHPFPTPDAEVVTDLDDQADGVPGWLPERVDEVRKWRREALPGRGVGGGRPSRRRRNEVGKSADRIA